MDEFGLREFVCFVGSGCVFCLIMLVVFVSVGLFDSIFDMCFLGCGFVGLNVA